jgi:hypothetical protein
MILAMWGCMAELDPECKREIFDMTNAASTWVGLIAGVGIGAAITWWIYYRQKKISDKQDHLIKHMVKLEDKILNLEQNMLEKVTKLSDKIDSTREKNSSVDPF